MHVLYELKECLAVGENVSEACLNECVEKIEKAQAKGPGDAAGQAQEKTTENVGELVVGDDGDRTYLRHGEEKRKRRQENWIRNITPYL